MLLNNYATTSEGCCGKKEKGCEIIKLLKEKNSGCGKKKTAKLFAVESPVLDFHDAVFFFNECCSMRPPTVV